MVSSPAIAIIDYQQRWPEEFRGIGARLRAALGGLALRIDHIGSTAVPGLAAKDVIDIQVTVAALDPAEPLNAAMHAAAGYRPRFSPDTLLDDHRPPGDAGPAAHWQKRYYREPEGVRRTHIHVRAAGMANQRYALLCRDYLRATPPAAESYARVKCALARLHPTDTTAYYDVKDPVFDIIMAGAELWAAAIGWTPGPSDA